jgi:Holliday junction resolvase RusA-like endonuclease
MGTRGEGGGSAAAFWYPRFVVPQIQVGQKYLNVTTTSCVLPLPPSHNHGLTPTGAKRGAKMMTSPEVREWRGEADVMYDRLYQWLITRHLSWSLPELTDVCWQKEELYLFLHFAFPSGLRIFDDDNRIKPTKDFLTGRFWRDDSQVIGCTDTTSIAADMIWHEWMPPCLRMGNTESVVPHVYVECLPVASLKGIEMTNWLSCKRR